MLQSEKEKKGVECREKIGKLFSEDIDPLTAEELINEIKMQDKEPLSIEQFVRIWNVSGKLKAYHEIDVNSAGKRVKQPVFSKKDYATQKILTYLERSAAILFIPLLIASLFYYFTNRTIPDQQFAYNELDNAYGTVSKLTLPDGTKVWLNSGSHFKYPLIFNKGIRKVYLSGEAYFEVTKNKKKPFVVSTSDIDVMATGTVFNVMAYKNENNIEATLISGKISLAKETKSSLLPTPVISISPGQRAILNKGKKKIILNKVDITKIISWKDGKLIFEDDPMDVVVKKLDRWYNTKIILVDPELKTYRYTATFDGETLPQILELLKHSAPIEYTIFPRKKRDNNTFTKGKVEIRMRKGFKNKTLR